ncbi:MAG: hypothetical protein KF745_00365 [Phycisphaeraceae bacterium]|nr:hypothetical protein [Phycisphaeraceae bacterium]
MAAPATKPTTVAWLQPEQVPLVRAALDAAGVHLLAAGCPTPGRSGEVAELLGLDPGDSAAAPSDLRSALATTECSLMLLVAPGDFAGRADGSVDEELDSLRAARARGLKVASLEPIPCSALHLASPALVGDTPGDAVVSSELVRFIPLARLSSPMQAVSDVMDHFGEIRAMVFESWSRPIEGSLGARVMDAMDTILTLLGEPESIDAAYVWPGARATSGTALRKMNGESLRGLSGDLTANLRFADGRSACIAVSDNAGRWGRTITLIGSRGRLRVYDDGLEWIGPDGSRVDSSRGVGSGRVSPEHAPGEGRSAAIIGEAIERYVSGREAAPAPVNYRRVLAMAGAALLSARTGEGESPATIQKMAMLPA